MIVSNKFWKCSVGSQEYIEQKIRAMRRLQMICASKNSLCSDFRHFWIILGISQKIEYLTIPEWFERFFRVRRIFLQNELWENPLRVRCAFCRTWTSLSFISLALVLAVLQNVEKNTLKRLVMAVEDVLLNSWILGYKCFLTFFEKFNPIV